MLVDLRRTTTVFTKYNQYVQRPTLTAYIRAIWTHINTQVFLTFPDIIVQNVCRKIWFYLVITRTAHGS